MVKALTILEKELPGYINEVKAKNQENAKAMAFSSFIQKVFDIESKDLDFEVPIKSEVMEMRGRIDFWKMLQSLKIMKNYQKQFLPKY